MSVRRISPDEGRVSVKALQVEIADLRRQLEAAEHDRIDLFLKIKDSYYRGVEDTRSHAEALAEALENMLLPLPIPTWRRKAEAALAAWQEFKGEQK